MNIDIDTIKESLMPHVESLKAFNFTYDNPVFWIALLVLFLILFRFWYFGKAFSFSILLALILLGATKLEGVIGNWVLEHNASFDFTLTRVIFLFVIAIIFIYYAFVKD